MMPETRFDLTAEVPAVADLGRVHVLAVGGAGMSAVARLLHAAGCVVTGSDAADSPLLAVLAAEGIGCVVGHDAAHVAGADTVVVSSAIRDSNVELAAARAAGVRILHRSQALASLTLRAGAAAAPAAAPVVAVAGANGKTTTTSMLTSALIDAGADPSYAIGGELTASGSNAHLGGPDAPFVVEADESDGSFVVYRPSVAIVTNVQPDHLDFYGTFARVEEAYATFVRTLRPGGLLVACVDDPGSARLLAAARADGIDAIGYGFDPGADVRLFEAELELDLEADAATRPDRLTSAALLRQRGAPDRVLRIGLPGRHNLLNAAAAFAAATAGLGADPDAILSGLAAFRGVRRRFEVLGTAAGVTVVDDYAHNPGKVRAVVETAAALARPGSLVAIFQPHLYSRTRDFAAEFAAGLAPADVVVVLDVYAAREDPMPGVSGRLVSDALRGLPGERTVVDASLQTAPDALGSLLHEGDLVLTIGAGSVTTLGPVLLSSLAGQGRA